MAYPRAMDTHPTLPQALWELTPPAVQAYVEALAARLASMGDLAARVVALEALVQALQERLNQPSQHASRPPASPPQPPHPRRSRGKRHRGGQPGHPGHTHTLLPVDAVDEMVVLKPEPCPRCPAAVAGDDPTPWRHHVIEMPPLKPVVPEYQWPQLVYAPWPTGVPSGTYGPRVPATGAWWTGA